MRRIFGLLALLCGNLGYADTEFWISVGSFSDREHAEEHRALASGQLQETFTITAADTPNGYFYRVIAGPYLSSDSSAYTLQRAHDAGFEDAWMIATEGPESAYRIADFDDDLPPLSELPLLPKLPTVEQAKPIPEPVREAPAGYKLHKLHRDG